MFEIRRHRQALCGGIRIADKQSVRKHAGEPGVPHINLNLVSRKWARA
jgi:hypothetical protein